MGARRSVRFAAVAAAALVAGLLPGTDSAASGGGGELSMAYACRFATGAQDVTVAFRQEFPAIGRRGKPIQPGDLTMTVTIPRAGVTAMLPAQAAAVTAQGDLTAHITQGASAADADWPGLTAEATPVAGQDGLVLTLSGKVPAVTVNAAGDVVFNPAALALTLHPRAAAPSGGTSDSPPPTTGSGSGSGGSPGSGAASGSSTGSGTGSAAGNGTGGHVAAQSAAQSAADAAATAGSGDTAGSAATAGSGSGISTGLADVVGACTPAPGQDTALATVPVPGGAGGTPSPGGPASAGRTPAAGGTSPGSPGAAGGTAAAGRTPAAIVPQDEPVHSGLTSCGKTPTGDPDPKRLPPVSSTAIVLPLAGQPPFPPGPMCGFAVGFSNVDKLNGAMIINDPHAHPVMAEVNGGRRKVLDYTKEYVEVDSVLDLTLPPSTATFLTYGFVPTSASVQFVPKGLMTVVQSGDTFFDQPILTTIGGYQEIRVHNVKINGTPLDVGPNCHTATPIDVELKGREDDYLPGGDGKPDYDIVNGGPLVDENLVVPPFTGCSAHGENLDALFTASLSGPGNTLNLSQGRLCDPVNVPETTCRPEIQIPQLPQRRH